MLKTHDGEWHKVAWSVSFDEASGQTKSELYVDCRKVSEQYFERSPSPQMSSEGIAVLGRPMMGDEDVFVGDIHLLDLYDDPTAASYMCEPHLELTPSCQPGRGEAPKNLASFRAQAAHRPQEDSVSFSEVDENDLENLDQYDDISNNYGAYDGEYDAEYDQYGDNYDDSEYDDSTDTPAATNNDNENDYEYDYDPTDGPDA